MEPQSAPATSSPHKVTVNGLHLFSSEDIDTINKRLQLSFEMSGLFVGEVPVWYFLRLFLPVTPVRRRTRSKKKKALDADFSDVPEGPGVENAMYEPFVGCALDFSFFACRDTIISTRPMLLQPLGAVHHLR